MVIPYAPFTGVLQLPDRAGLTTTTSPVTLPDGRPLAVIQWQAVSVKGAFEILDPGGGLLGTGTQTSAFARRYEIRDPRGAVLLTVKASLWGPAGRSLAWLPDGRQLTIKGRRNPSRYEVTDAAGASVARLLWTGRTLSKRPDSYTFDIAAPALTLVQAIGLAQCLRQAAIRART